MALSKEEQMCFYKIADALMVPLTVNEGEVSGSCHTMMKTSIEGLKLPFTFKAQKMFNYEQVGVLFFVAGDLYILVAHNYEGQASSAFLIDASKCEDGGVKTRPESLVAKRSNLGEAVHNLGKSIVASFYRKTSSNWAPLTL